MFGKVTATLIGGIVIGFLVMTLVTLAMANNPEAAGSAGAAAFLVGFAGCAVLAFTASAGAKAWRRVFITSGLLSFALPLSTLIFGGAAIVEASKEGTAQAAGATIGAGLVAGVAGLVGVILGIIFLVIGLLIGRDKQVVVIRESADGTGEAID